MRFASNPEFRSVISYNVARMAAASTAVGAMLLSGCASSERPNNPHDTSPVPAATTIAPLEPEVGVGMGSAVQESDVTPEPTRKDPTCKYSPLEPAPLTNTYPLAAAATSDCNEKGKSRWISIFTQPNLGSPVAGKVAEGTPLASVCTIIGRPVRDKDGRISKKWNVVEAMPGENLPVSGAGNIYTVPARALGYSLINQIPCTTEQLKKS